MARILLLLILLSATTAHGLTVTFLPQAEVADNVVTLGDIATFDEQSEFSQALASQPVGQSPSPGQQITLKTRPIINHLNGAIGQGVPVTWQGSATTDITRNALQIGSAEILDIIDAYLKENTRHLPGATIRFRPAAQPLPFALPSGEMTYQVIPSDPDIVGSTRFSLIFSVDGRVRKNMSVRGEMEVHHQVVVTTKDLAKGTILSPKNTTLKVMEIGRLREPILDPRKVLGKRLQVSVKADQPLSHHQVEFPPLVHKGQLVKMILQRGGLFVTATGVARSDGIANETIRVKNAQSNKIVYCRVAAPGVVEVLL